MKCKINSGDKSRLTRTSSTRATKSNISSSASSSHPTNFKIKFKHGLSLNSDSSNHGSRTQTRSSTSSTVSTSKGKSDIKNNDHTRAAIRDGSKESKKPKEDVHKCKCICSNCGLSVNDSGPDDRDVSTIREPINLGTNNVRQILQCVHNGTPEIKDIILNECNIIYECRICRNLFRSLANLLSHKRFYCKDHQCENMLLFDDSYSDRLLGNYTIGSKTQTDQNTASHNKQSGSRDSRPMATKTSTEQKETSFNFSDSEHSKQLLKSSEDNVASSNIQPDKLAAKRKHLELCVNKLLHEKQSSKVESLVHLTEISTTKNAVHQIYETKPKESDSIDNYVHNSRFSNQDGEFPAQEVEQSSFSVPGSQTHEDSVKQMQTEVYNIDENANHSVACEETELNLQETSGYSRSISSLVSDDEECSRESVIMKSASISELENESIDVEDVVVNKELSQQSIPSSPSSSSSNHYQSREHTSIRNKPKTFNDDYETKSPSAIANLPCSMCNSKFSSKKTLTVHIQTIHNIQRLVYPCPFCCLTFKQLFNATRHMMQVHRKGKTQVKYLREAVKHRAYPETKTDVIDESETIHTDYNDDTYGTENESDVSRDTVDMDQEKVDCYPLSNDILKTTPSELELVPIKVGKSSKRKSCDKSRSEYKSTTEITSDETNAYKNFGSENTNDVESDLQQTTNTTSTHSVDKDAKPIVNQEKVRRVDPIIFTCINNCGKYFIKADSKNQHEKGCSKPDECEKEINTEQKIISPTACRNLNSNENLDLVIPDSIYNELEKVGNLNTLQCNNCPDLQFDSKTNLIEHLVKHKGYEIFKCKKCAYQTLDRTELNNHLNNTHGNPEILRENCTIKVSTPNNSSSSELTVKKDAFQPFKEDSQEVKKPHESKSSEKSISSGIVLHLRPKLSRNRKKKKIYEIVGD
ncbi:zinc finger protein 800 isoform X2 [Tetranychus urticae]|nr:zinc finger protein 800 isoform X2 [Tetranychus urticae]